MAADDRGEGDPQGQGAGTPGSAPEGSDFGSTRFVRFALYFYGGMIAAALIWRMGLHGESILYSAPGPPAGGSAFLRDAGIGLVVGLAVVGLSHAITRLTRWGETLARRLGEAIGRVSTPDAILLAMASGIGEELFFRGALQPRVGLVVASVLFGAVHFVPRRDMLPWTGFAVVVGLLLGVLFEWTGNIVAPVVAHTVVNAINLPYLVRRYGRTD
jgi:membrane protease YdiL (CAAX protease family)